MKTQTRALALPFVLTLMFGASSVMAAPCTIERNEHGMWIGNCTLKEFLYPEARELEQLML